MSEGILRGVFMTLGLCCTTFVAAQRIAIKTNALYWAASSPNLGLEMRINRHLTFNLEGTFNRLKIGKYDTRAEVFTPEMRYWFSARPQAGHFIGFTALAANYDLLLKHQRHDGDAFGAGLTYGYSFVLSRHWSLEATIGVGALYRREKNYNESSETVPTEINFKKWQPFPLKAGLNFVYIIK